MSPLRMGRARVAGVSSEELARRTSELSLALHVGADALDPDAVALARRAVDKADERLTIAGDHTVVALAGATGSGKSSLFNAIVGADVAAIGARRPTTSKPTAAIFGGDDAGPLLDWLEIDARYAVPEREEPDVAGSLDGLVLLDLPDFDSREESHRVEAERVLELVDVFVWVTDPQKYADSRLHDEFVRTLAHHGGVTLSVLNQSDRLSPVSVAACLTDLRRLMRADGLTEVAVLPTSARTGEGMTDFKQRLANVAASRTAARARLNADVLTVASTLRGGVSDSEPPLDRISRDQIDVALARAAGVPVVLDAVARDYRREAYRHTGWLFARWTRALRADPLRRLRLDAGTRKGAVIPLAVEGADVRAVLGRSSIPAPTASMRASVDVATRDFVRAASDGLPPRWADAVEDAVAVDDGDLGDALDQAVMGTSLRARRPAWWFVLGALQWLLGMSTIGGAVWLLVLYVLGIMQLPPPEVPRWGVVPLPLIMLVLGILLGLAVGALGRWWASVGAENRKALIADRLHESVAAVTDERVLSPVGQVLDRHAETRAHLEAATA